MQKSSGDPLLTAARVLAIVIIGVLIFALVMVGVGIGVMLTVGQQELWDRIAVAGAPKSAYWAVIGAFTLIAAALTMALRFFQALHRIVISVDRGTPFEAANALRLRDMGWLSLGVQLILIPLGAIGTWLEPYLERLGEEFPVDVGVDPGALLLVLVLFILARVFRQGAAMRADLDGIV